jgi:hypothetical protein
MAEPAGELNRSHALLAHLAAPDVEGPDRWRRDSKPPARLHHRRPRLRARTRHREPPPTRRRAQRARRPPDRRPGRGNQPSRAPTRLLHPSIARQRPILESRHPPRRPRRLFQARRLLGGYDDLRPRATLQTVAGTTIALPIASLAGIEHSKRTATRPEDLRYRMLATANHGPKQKPRVCGVFVDRSIDGASRARTGDLLGAIQALSQLSYSPAGGPAKRPTTSV